MGAIFSIVFSVISHVHEYISPMWPYLLISQQQNEEGISSYTF